MSAQVQKATHEQLRRHNRQLLLRALYQRRAGSRAGLAQATGLTKPTVSSLTAELIEEGLIRERGRGPASESGGKRPRLIEFRPEARQVIGVSVDHDGVHAVLTDLAGQASARHRVATDEERPLDAVTGAIDGLRAQLDAPLACIGVGVPGEVDAVAGVVRTSARMGWRDLAVAPPLSERYGVPVHMAQGTELCALAQYAFGAGRRSGPQRLVTLLVSHGVEIGVTLEGGSVHYGGDLSAVMSPRLEPGGGRTTLAEQVRSWGEQASAGEGDPQAPPDYLALRYAAANGDASAVERVEALAQRLGPLVAWTVALLRPDQLTLAGPVVDLGEDVLARVRDAAAGWLSDGELRTVEFSLAYTGRLGPLGAVALALQRELAII